MSSLVPILNKGLLYANNCQVSIDTATSVIIASGQLRDSTNVFDITVSNELTVRTDYVGAGGLDTGVIGIDTFYALYVISDPTNMLQPIGLLSLSSSNPVMPSVRGVTYGAYRLIGYVKTDASGDLLKCTIIGNGNERTHYWDLPISALSGGASSTFADITLEDSVPSIMAISDSSCVAASVQCSVSFTSAVAGNYAGFISGASASTIGTWLLSGSVAAVPQIAQMDVCADYTIAEMFVVKYKNSAALCSSSVDITGFKYFI